MGTRSPYPTLATAALVAVVVALAVPAAAASNPAPWDVIATPNPDTGGARLASVVSITPSDAWAVGPGRARYFQARTLTQHWDGQSWNIVESPNPAGATSAWLTGVAAASSSDVWAVGGARLGSGATETLIQRWNGAGWAIVPSPDSGSPSMLHDVEVVSATDAWAVGESPSGSLILRWNGSQWNQVSNPCSFSLRGVTAISGDDVWAVGQEDTCHWDGQGWSKVPGAAWWDYNTILDVSGAASNDVWAVGQATICPYDCWSLGFIQHWDGTKWTVVRSWDDRFFAGVKAVSATEVYAVGQDCCGRTLLLLWNGHRWRQAPQPEVSGSLSDVAASSPSDLWAVGTTISSGPPTTLAERAPAPTSGGLMGNTGVSKATVSWFGPESGSTQTDSAGDYAVGGLGPGTYNVFATAQGCDPAQATVTVSAGTTLFQDLPLTC